MITGGRGRPRGTRWEKTVCGGTKFSRSRNINSSASGGLKKRESGLHDEEGEDDIPFYAARQGL